MFKFTTCICLAVSYIYAIFNPFTTQCSIYSVIQPTFQFSQYHTFVTLGVPQRRGHWGVPNNAMPQEKLANTEIPCQKSTKYRYLNYDRTRLLKAVFISRVCLPQACMHQKSTSDIGRKSEKTLIGSTIKKPGHWMPFQFCHRLYNHLPLLV